ncbi:hypothetical protein DXA57_06360 [Blautia sp. OF03-15BH]|nr:hypothetical protein DXA57_06360 [Blautia sp. OF03-15BH]
MFSSGAIRRYPLEACETEAMEENKMKKRRKFWLFCLLAALVAAIAAPVCLAAENETVVQEETLVENEKTAVEGMAETEVETTEATTGEKIVFVLIMVLMFVLPVLLFFVLLVIFTKLQNFILKKTGRIPKKKK